MRALQSGATQGKWQPDLAAIPPMRACVCLNDNQWRHRRQRSVIPAGTGMTRRGEEITWDAARSSADVAGQGFQHPVQEFTQVLGLTGPQRGDLARRSQRDFKSVS